MINKESFIVKANLNAQGFEELRKKRLQDESDEIARQAQIKDRHEWMQEYTPKTLEFDRRYPHEANDDVINFVEIELGNLSHLSRPIGERDHEKIYAQAVEIMNENKLKKESKNG